MTDYRKDFPLLSEIGENTVDGREWIYIDNAATSQRPQCVIDAERDFYLKHNANPLRGNYPLSVEATELYENARKGVRDFIGAKSAREIIFTRNTTESMNLVAYSYGLTNVKEGGRNSCLHHGAPQQSSAMADGRPTDRSKTAVYRVPPGWISRSGSGAGTDYRKDEDRRNHTGFQCPWADQSNQRDRSHGT